MSEHEPQWVMRSREGADRGRRMLAAVARTLDLLPDAAALLLGLALGLALVAASSRNAAWWVLVPAVGAALGLGLRAEVRPKSQGWVRPTSGAMVTLALAGGLLGIGMEPAQQEGPSWQELTPSDAEAMRWDLGDGGGSTDGSTGGTTGGSEDTGASTEGESTGQEASSSSGGDESTGEAPPPRPPERRPRPAVTDEPPVEDVAGARPARTIDLASAVPTARLGIHGGGAVTLDPSRLEPRVEPGEEARCREGMTFIAGGSFDGHDIESFCLDTTEVRVSSYERCMRDGKCGEAGKEWGLDGDYSPGDYCNRNHDDRGSHPMNCVDWKQAVAFCAWAGKRLPTQWEWEWAARGRDRGWTYPWGDAPEPSCERVVMREGADGCGKDRTWAVGSKPKGNSRDGVSDLAGNVWEWTSSKEGERRIVRGGSWDLDFPGLFRASYRFDVLPADRFLGVGFRCARTAARPQ